MPSFVVVAGADVEAGSGISARIDLNLHLAPPTTADFLRLGSGPSTSSEQQQQQQQQPQQQQQQQHVHQEQRRILPRFGPGIHGVFLDLHQENDEGSSSSSSGRRASLSASLVHGEDEHGDRQQQQQPHFRHRAPIHHRFRRMASASPSSVVFERSFERSRIRIQEAMRSIRHPHAPPPPQEPKDKDPVRQGDEDERASGAVKAGTNGADNNFECNVCLDIAVEPVVTVCGHLFCWHCLYEWLYVHSDNEECPVCKGFVCESSIIPIYGRGSSSSSTQQQQQQQQQQHVVAAAEHEEVVAVTEPSRGYVPPRPRARRVDSLRQRMEAGSSMADWEGTVLDEGDPEGRRAFLHLDEVLRMRRAVRYFQDSVMGRSRFLRRRMSERREHYRTPSQPPSPPAAPSAAEISSAAAAAAAASATAAAAAAASAATRSRSIPATMALNDLEMRPTYDYARSRSETEDRVAVIRARLANLVETIESHRRQASLMASRQQSDPSVTVHLVAQQQQATAAARVAQAAAAVDPAAAAAAAADEDDEVETGEGSGCGDDMDAELLHSRKRRRLN